MLARTSIGGEGHWPSEPDRELIESSPSDLQGRGLYIAVINKRGFTTRNPGDGGKQELTLVAQYEAWAKSLASTAPRTSGLLMDLANSYRSEAQRQDVHAERFN
jgi:hypothetical protein